MRLVACPSCHTQFDVTHVIAEKFPCRCGAEIENRVLTPVDAAVHRCSSCGAIADRTAGDCTFCGSAIIRDPGRLSLICPECYARTADESRFCTACGVSFHPEEVRIEGHELPCPVCDVLMPPHQIGGVGINECVACNGLWVPDESFDLLVSKAIESRKNASDADLLTLKPRTTGGNPASQRVQYRKCPECQGFMHRRNYRKCSGVIIDVCSAHGTWLDSDELEQIAGFILAGNAPEQARLEPERTAGETRAAAAWAEMLTAKKMEGAYKGPETATAGSLLEVLFNLLD